MGKTILRIKQVRAVPLARFERLRYRIRSELDFSIFEARKLQGVNTPKLDFSRISKTAYGCNTSNEKEWVNGNKEKYHLSKKSRILIN